MRVLYAAMYSDPRDPDASSGVDYNFYTSIKRHTKDVEIAGPFRVSGLLPERLLKRLYTTLTHQRYLKWNLRAIWRANYTVNQLEKAWQPDVVFTIFPSTLVQYRGQAPSIFVTDLTFQAWQEHGAGFGRLALKGLVWVERQAMLRSVKVITHSQWAKEEIMRRHGISQDQIEIVTMPAALPAHVVPDLVVATTDKKLESSLRLLLVGREYHRKGVDIAIEVVAKLNAQQIPAELVVCATTGPEAPFVRYVGPYRKSDPQQLKQYTEWYRWAHFLLHPARFEPAGIVPGEAAAFGTPTITNDTGGLATTVKHQTSGIVLPKNSSPQAYVQVIKELVDSPERYYALCQSTRQRYETELNWDVAGKQVATILEQVVRENPRRTA
jgi:glycosyltransferase involved in cell wall biosynthesis